MVVFFIQAGSYSQTQPRDENLKQMAQKQMEAGRFGEAIDLLNKYISANPRLPEGYNLRGICFENRGQYQQAVLDYRRAVRLDPEYGEAAKNLARTQKVWYDLLKKKIIGHEREIFINPDIAYNYLEIGKSYRLMEEWKLAEEWYDKYLEKDPNASPDEIIRYAEILAKTGSITKGEKKLKEYVDRYPDDWRLLSRYGYFTMWLGKYKTAENAFRSALEFKPFFKEAQDGLDQATKQAYLTQQDPRAFEKEFPIDRYYRVLRQNPKDMESRYKLIDELIKADRIEEAYQQLEILGVENADDPRFKEKWEFVTSYRTDLYKSRAAEFESRIKVNPLDKTAIKGLVQYYQYLEQFDNALTILEEYFRSVPDEQDEELKFQYSRAAAWARDFDLAIVLIDDLLKRKPDNLDYQLFRAQLSVWTQKDLDLASRYLSNVLERKPDNFDALISIGSLKLLERDFQGAQEYADKAALINPLDKELLTLRSNIEFQKLRAEEEKRYEILEKGREFVRSGDCVSALSFYEEYLSQAEPNNILLKEYADILYCAEKLREALGVYDELLLKEYDYQTMLQKGKIQYAIGDSLGSVETFKELSEKNPGEFEPLLYLGDSYAKLRNYKMANQVYDSLLNIELDSMQMEMVSQRQEWIPPVGLESILMRFPSSIGIAPSASFYSDNLSFRLTKIGARLDIGATHFLAFGISFYKTYLKANQSTLDPDILLRMQIYPNFSSFVGSRSFTSFKGHIFLNITRDFRISAGSGVINSFGIENGNETEVSAIFEAPDSLKITALFNYSDAAIILYSPYLIDFRLFNRLYASLFKIQGEYIHNKKWLFSGHYQYVAITDNNEGYEFQLRGGYNFYENLFAGYEYFFSNFKFTYSNSPFYYSPGEFESHSIWGDYILQKSRTTEIRFGGKLGFVPLDKFIIIQAYLNAQYSLTSDLQIGANIAMGSTSRNRTSYRYFSGGVSAYWSF